MERSRLRMASLLLLLSLLYQKLDLCSSLNHEGRALLRFRERVVLDPYGALSNWDVAEEDAIDPCSWFGIECSDGRKVVVLNLKDLCLKGTLAPELGQLVHMKSLILHNNSFYGVIPKEIGKLQKLEVLDLGHNNLSGPLPSDLGSILSLENLILRSNSFAGSSILPEHYGLNMLFELQVDEDLISSNRGTVTRNVRNATIRKLLQSGRTEKVENHRSDHINVLIPSPSPSPSPIPSRWLSPSRSPMLSPSQTPILAPSPAASSPSFSFPPSPDNHFLTPEPSPSPINELPSPASENHPVRSDLSPSGSRSPSVETVPQVAHKTSWPTYMSIVAGVSFLLALSAVYILCCRANKVVTIRPWTTGLSGQLQKAFVTGVPALRRSELETACEGFSNVIGSLSDGILYKGTLSSGVEIAVASSVVTSAKGWSKNSEAQFRKKISMLSKVNHKNFVNLLGYCAEEEPFTRMMVFEYASNGTLFEHLHIAEAEHLDWAVRLRIAMGVAYCLEYMHQLNPPVILRNIHSSSIYLTDDYAAKISDFGYWNKAKVAKSASESSGLLDTQLSDPKSIVYKFGVILLEIISGRLPFSEDDGLLVYWASSYLSGKSPLKDMIDPTLKSFREEDISAMCEVIRSCIDPDPKERPTMGEVAGRLREITAMSPDGATPKLSPLWWAELEILSSEAI